MLLLQKWSYFLWIVLAMALNTLAFNHDRFNASATTMVSSLPSSISTDSSSLNVVEVTTLLSSSLNVTTSEGSVMNTSMKVPKKAALAGDSQRLLGQQVNNDVKINGTYGELELLLTAKKLTVEVCLQNCDEPIEICYLAKLPTSPDAVEVCDFGKTSQCVLKFVPDGDYAWFMHPKMKALKSNLENCAVADVKPSDVVFDFSGPQLIGDGCEPNIDMTTGYIKLRIKNLSPHNCPVIIKNAKLKLAAAPSSKPNSETHGSASKSTKEPDAESANSDLGWILGGSLFVLVIILAGVISAISYFCCTNKENKKKDKKKEKQEKIKKPPLVESSNLTKE